MIKRILKITGLVFVTSTALVACQTVMAGDVEVILPASTDAFTVDQPAGTELMRVHGDGNVGIGTSIPSVKLHVVDDDAAYQTQFLIENKNASIPNIYEYKGGYAWQKTAFDSWNGEPRFMMSRSRGTLDAPTVNQDGDYIGQIEFRAYDGGTLRRGASIRAEVDGTVAVSNMPGSLHFLTEEEGGSDLVERMVIRNDGKVGIGTETPDSKLHVDGGAEIHGAEKIYGSAPSVYSAYTVYRKDRNGASVNSGDELGQVLSAGFDGNTYNYSTRIMMRAGPGTISSTSSPGSIAFGTVSDGSRTVLDRMLINPDGDVGIGTNVPTSKLQVVGLPIHADNAAAKAAGLTNGAFFHNGDGILRVVF